MPKISSKGTLIKLSISASFTTIVACENVTAPDAEVGVIDVTALEDGVGRDKILTGYVEGGRCAFSGFFDPVAATHQAITDLITAPASSSWRIDWSDAAVTQWPFTAFVKKFTPRAAVGEALRFDSELECDGMVTYPT